MKEKQTEMPMCPFCKTRMILFIEEDYWGYEQPKWDCQCSNEKLTALAKKIEEELIKGI